MADKHDSFLRNIGKKIKAKHCQNRSNTYFMNSKRGAPASTIQADVITAMGLNERCFYDWF